MPHTYTFLPILHSGGGAKIAYFGTQISKSMNVAFTYTCQSRAFQFAAFPLGTPYFLATIGFYINLHHSEYLSFHIHFSKSSAPQGQNFMHLLSSTVAAALLQLLSADGFLPFSCSSPVRDL